MALCITVSTNNGHPKWNCTKILRDKGAKLYYGKYLLVSYYIKALTFKGQF